jgi:hypothetical protein
MACHAEGDAPRVGAQALALTLICLHAAEPTGSRSDRPQAVAVIGPLPAGVNRPHPSQATAPQQTSSAKPVPANAPAV